MTYEVCVLIEKSTQRLCAGQGSFFIASAFKMEHACVDLGPEQASMREILTVAPSKCFGKEMQ